LWCLLGVALQVFDCADLNCAPISYCPKRCCAVFAVLNVDRQFKSSPIGLADVLIISMCAYTKLFIACNAAVSGLNRGRVWARASLAVSACLAAMAVGGTRLASMTVRLRVATGIAPAALCQRAQAAVHHKADPNGGQQKSQHKLAGLIDSAKQFRVMVAGAGFEPTTFGL
jgi:hypothetical protein